MKKRMVAQEGQFKVLVYEDGLYHMEKDVANAGFTRAELLQVAMVALKAYETDKAYCPSCEGALTHHFSGNAEMPAGFYCGGCQDALYDEKGNEICRME